MTKSFIDQEARARRRNLRIFNVPENEEQGSTVTVFLEKFLREKLNLPDSLELNIERAHRALAPKPADGEKPRSIVAQFLQYRTKEEILRKAWEKKGIYVNTQRIYFDHDYPTAILNRRKEYNEAKRILREKKIRFQTPYPFKLRVFYEDETRVYHTAHEATKDMHDRGFAREFERQPFIPPLGLSRVYVVQLRSDYVQFLTQIIDLFHKNYIVLDTDGRFHTNKNNDLRKIRPEVKIGHVDEAFTGLMRLALQGCVMVRSRCRSTICSGYGPDPADCGKPRFTAVRRIQDVSRSEEGPAPRRDDNAVLKCQQDSPFPEVRWTSAVSRSDGGAAPGPNHDAS
ncbi:hypothetical protein PO909_025041 [Leuciscus waleckii]